MDALSETVLRPLAGVVAGTTVQTGSAVDMAGWTGVKFYYLFGAITAGAVTSCEVQQSSDDGVGDAYTDLEGTNVAVADDDDNQVVVIDIKNPRERYLKPQINRATQNAVIDGILAVRYGPRTLPTSESASVVVSREQHISPAEGTA